MSVQKNLKMPMEIWKSCKWQSWTAIIHPLKYDYILKVTFMKIIDENLYICIFDCVPIRQNYYSIQKKILMSELMNTVN